MELVKNLKVTTTEKGMVLSWEKAQGGAKLFWAYKPQYSADAEYIAEIDLNKGEYQSEILQNQNRIYFFLVMDKQVQTVAERSIAVEGVANFRDLGGYVGKGGKCVKWGKLLRSAAHDGLSDSGVQMLKTIGLKTVVDYRSNDEVMRGPDREIEGVEYLHIQPVAEAGVTDILKIDTESKESAMEGLKSINQYFAISKDAHQAYRELLELLLEEKTPLVQHCTAGKDRVGVGSALILAALGVDEKTIMEDYLLSNEGQLSVSKLTSSLPSEITLSQEQLEIFHVLSMVREEYLGAFFENVKKHYQNIDNFIVEALGISEEELKKLQDLYLE